MIFIVLDACVLPVLSRGIYNDHPRREEWPLPRAGHYYWMCITAEPAPRPAMGRDVGGAGGGLGLVLPTQKHMTDCRGAWGHLSLAELVSCQSGWGGAASEEGVVAVLTRAHCPPPPPHCPVQCPPLPAVCPGFPGISVSSDHLSWWLKW